MKRLSMVTQFKIEFLPPFADCRKVLGKIPASVLPKKICLAISIKDYKKT